MTGYVDVYARDQLQDTALHSYTRGDYPVTEKMNMLIAILTFSKLGCKDVDVKALYGNTALHIAAQVKMLVITKCIVMYIPHQHLSILNYVFNQCNISEHTPLVT